jgi:hypothetical protein
MFALGPIRLSPPSACHGRLRDLGRGPHRAVADLPVLHLGGERIGGSGEPLRPACTQSLGHELNGGLEAEVKASTMPLRTAPAERAVRLAIPSGTLRVTDFALTVNSLLAGTVARAGARARY